MQQLVVKTDIEAISAKSRNELKTLEGAKILITGAAGMLAGYLVRTFIFANQKILKKPASLYLIIRKKIKPFGNFPYVHYVHADISKSLPPLKRINYIIHTASKSAPKFYLENPVDTINSNILGLYNLLNLDPTHLKGFLFFSSGEIYSPLDHLSARASYKEAKKACETILINHFRQFGLPVKIARIFHCFGPGLNLNDGRVFSDFIKNAVSGQNIEIKGDKNIKRPLLYIKDATIMFIKLLVSHKNGVVYDISAPQNISVGEFAQIVANEANVKVVFKKTSAKFYKNAVKSYSPDISKFIKDFNYKPSTSIKIAVERTFKYYSTQS